MIGSIWILKRMGLTYDPVLSLVFLSKPHNQNNYVQNTYNLVKYGQRDRIEYRPHKWHI